LSEENKPENLVECMRKIDTDDTLKLFSQVIKFQFRVNPEKPLSIQLVLDRVHKFQKGESKPLGYLRFSQSSDLLDLARQALACACVLQLSANSKDITTFDIERAMDSAWSFLKSDATHLIHLCLNEVKAKQIELQLPRLPQIVEEKKEE